MANGIDQPLYFVECDFGKLGKTFIETNRDRNSRQDVIDNILSGEYRDVITVLECNPVERTCRDVTEDILTEVAAALVPIFPDVAAERLTAKWDHARDLRKEYLR